MSAACRHLVVLGDQLCRDGAAFDPHLAPQVRNLARIDEAERAAIRTRAEHIRAGNGASSLVVPPAAR